MTWMKKPFKNVLEGDEACLHVYVLMALNREEL